MAKYLISTVETYRVDSEPEVNQILEEAKTNKQYELQRYNCTQKEVKVKGEVVDAYYKLSLTKIFTNEKEPDRQVEITYTGGGSYDGSVF